MASIASSAKPGRQTMEPSTQFYKELLQTGLFSDLTIKLGSDQTFKVHKSILMKKSPKFGRDIVADSYGTRLESSEKWDAKAFQSFLYYLYTGGYENQTLATMRGQLAGHFIDEDSDDCDDNVPIVPRISVELKHHIQVHQLGLIFEVPGLPEYAVNMFTDTLERLRTLGRHQEIQAAINEIYDMSLVNPADPLKQAAAKEFRVQLETTMGRASENIKFVMSKMPRAAIHFATGIALGDELAWNHKWKCDKGGKVFHYAHKGSVRSGMTLQSCPACPKA